jgi:uncharacterized membrane protein
VGAILILIGTAGGFASALAGAGALISVLGAVVLVGAIVLLVGLSGLGGVYEEKGLFRNSLYSFMVDIVGLVVAGGTIGYVAYDTSVVKNFLHELYPSWNQSWSTISSVTGLTPDTSNLTQGVEVSFAGAVLLTLVILMVFFVVAAFLAGKTLKSLSAKAGVPLFSTAATLLIIGAFLTVVFVGYIIIWVAFLLVAVAFLKVGMQQEQAPVAAAPAPSMPTPV